jgi:hypothetical protein
MDVKPDIRVLENGVLRRVFVANRDEVTGGWRKLRNAEFHNLHLPPSGNPLKPKLV